MLNWSDLLAAFAIYLVLEGLVPFASPTGFKTFMKQMIEMPDSRVRRVGLTSMIAGVVLLYIIR